MEFDFRLLAPLVTAVGITVSIILWRLNQKYKALSYNILWHAPVLNVKGLARQELDIRYAGESLTDAYLSVVEIYNSGHLAISASDFQTNLSIEFNPGAVILSTSIIETVPGDLEERCKSKSEYSSAFINSVKDGRAILNPVFMNERDSITVQMLVKNVKAKPIVGGHLLGVKEITPWRSSRLLPTILTQVGAFVMAFAMLGVQPNDLITFAFENVLPWSLLFLLGCVLFNAGLFWPKRRRTGFVG
ncbi:MAG TPA: hypothetical protein V6C76_18115 [Drouetiella sp.]